MLLNRLKRTERRAERIRAMLKLYSILAGRPLQLAKTGVGKSTGL